MRSLLTAFALFSIILITAFSCKTTRKLDNRNINYDHQWKAIDSLVERQLFEQAEKILNNIIEVAFEKDDEIEGVRAVLALSQLKIEDFDSYMTDKLPNIERVADTLDNETAKAIIHYAIAMSYFRYWENHSKDIPSNFEGNIPADLRINEWSEAMFMSKIDSEFNQAKVILKENDLPLQDIHMFFGSDSIKTSLTLLEFIYQEEISIYESKLVENHYSNKSIACRICNLFGEDFLTSVDTISTPYTYRETVMLLYQRLFKKFIASAKNDMWIEGEIQKIKFLYEDGNAKTGNDYELSLIALRDFSINYDLSYIPNYYLAEYLASLSNQQNYSKNERSTLIQRAVAIYEGIITGYPQTKYAQNAKSNLAFINKKDLSVLIEATNLPNTEILINVLHHKVEKVFYRIFKISKEDYIGQDMPGIEDYKETSLVSSGEIYLPPNKFPYIRQSTDVFLKGLPSGFYGIAIANHPNFIAKDDNTVFEASFLVSNIAIHQFKDEENGLNVLQAINRTTGDRLKSIDFSIYTRVYNQKKRKQEYILKESFKNVDEVKIAVNNTEVIYPLVEDSADFIMDKNGIYASYDRYNTITEASIFTDRSIYRPGQKIFFKGLLVQKDKKRFPSSAGNQKFEMVVNDAFGNELSKEMYKSDENGAFDGSIQLPEKLPNGRVSFQIVMNNQRIWVSNEVTVEEYKRPKFVVEFLPLEGKVAMNENISIKAKATTMIGLPVVDARVTYKIYRKKYLPYYYNYSYRIFPPFQSEEVLIASGETMSDNKGEILIDFIAISEQTKENKNTDYVFVIKADFTDVTGETQFQTKEIIIAEQSVFLTMDSDDLSPNKIQLSARNADGSEVKASPMIKIYKRNIEEYKIPRYWEFPDTVIQTSESVSSPYVLDEKEMVFGQLVYSEELELEGVRTIDLNEIVGPGNYKIYLSVKGGDTIEREVVVNNFLTGEFSAQDLVYFSINKKTLEVGEKLEIKIGSSVKGINFQLLKFKDNKLFDEKWDIINGVYELEDLITEDEKGGFTYAVTIFYKNRAYNYAHQISVPWIEKQLNIKPITFRSVTEPGSIEKWTFQVLDYKGKPVKAFFTTAMYDASLDKLKPHQWSASFFPVDQTSYYPNHYGFGQAYFSSKNYSWNNVPFTYIQLQEPLYFKYLPESYSYFDDFAVMRSAGLPGKVVSSAPPSPPPPSAELAKDGAVNEVIKEDLAQVSEPVIRRNLNETVFFQPLLVTDDQGLVDVDFTMNEALTTWKMINFVYTPELETGFSEVQVQTKKNVMIQANQVRFLRMNDEITLTAKLINLTEEQLNVLPELLTYNALTGESIHGISLNNPEAEIVLSPMEQKNFSWRLKVPEGIPLIRFIYQVNSKFHQDAEEHIIPVMSDKVYLIESEILRISGEGKEVFSLSEFSNNKKQSQRLVVESFGSPVWTVFQSLPYLSENKHEHADAIFNRYFANKLAIKLIRDNPAIKAYFNAWRDEGQLVSNLKTNDLLKNIDLNLTPWVTDALSEEAQMQLLATMINNENSEAETEALVMKLQELQLGNGGYPWFAKGRDSYYISQIILEGIIRMERMGLLAVNHELMDVKQRLAEYCQREELDIYKQFLKDKGDLVPISLLKGAYVNAMSGLGELKGDYKKMIIDIQGRIMKDWYKYQMEEQIYIAWILLKEQKSVALEIGQSFLERSFYSEQIGRYWKSNPNYRGYANEIEKHAKVIALFHELGSYNSTIEELKAWLISNKRNNSWASSIATSAAIYSLTLGENNSFVEGKSVATYLGEQELVSDINKVGVNYDKYILKDLSAISEGSKLEFKNPNKNTAWVNIHHQFFQNYEDVERTEGGALNLKKEMYLINDDDTLLPVSENILQNGDRISIRLLIESDRNMQFVHLMDERPSGMEPADQISGYNWNNGLNFYKSINDVATHFFIEYMPKGTFIIEYEMIVNNEGIYDSGVAKIQNLYAPEFNDFSRSFEITVSSEK